MGFIADLFGAKNNYQVDPNLPSNFQQTDYGSALAQALNQTGQFNPAQADATAGQQDALVAALQNQLSGNGPSVAQNQLRDATNQNIANTAGQIASIRGMNPALAARLIAQNAATQNQGMAGQAATLRAQEQMNTQGNLGNILAAKRNADISQAGTQGSLANNMIGTLGNLQGGQNNQVLQNKLGSAQINSQVAAQNANTNAAVGGGVLSGLASGAAQMASMGGGMAHGGVVGYADGGIIPAPFNLLGMTETAPGSAALGAAFSSMLSNNRDKKGISPSVMGSPAIQDASAAESGSLIGNMSDNGIMSAIPLMASSGGKVAGRAQVAGDSPLNDTVPVRLSPGEIVIPRTDADDPKKAKAFIDALKKKEKPAGAPVGYGDVLSSHRDLHDRLAILEMACGGMVHGYAGGGQVPQPNPAQQVSNGFLSNLGAAYLRTRMKRG